MTVGPVLTHSPTAASRKSAVRDHDAREAQILRYMPLARKLARRYNHSSLAHEDLVQVASLALVKAVDRFDEERGGTFESFAIPTILGELCRHFRDTSWAVHVARGAQERSKAIQDTITLLSREKGRAPTVTDLATYLELSEQEVLDGLQVAQAYTATSLEAPARSEEDDAELTVASTLGVEEPSYETVENRYLLDAAIAELPAREQRLLKLRFVDELTQSKIAERLGVSQMQISRLLQATLLKLRESVGMRVGAGAS